MSIDIKSSAVDIESYTTTPEIQSTGKSEVVVSVNEWVLGNASQYADSLNGNLPTWLNTAISNAIEVGNTDIYGVIEALSTALGTIETGVNQQITQLQTDLEAQAGLLTTTKAELNGDIAGVIQSVNTKVDSDGATSKVIDLVGSKWLNGNESQAESYVVGKAETVANNQIASSSVIQGLVSTVTDSNSGNTAIVENTEEYYTEAGIDPETKRLTGSTGYLNEMNVNVAGLMVQLTTEEGLSAGHFEEWDGVEDPRIGMIKSDGSGGWLQYVGGTFGPSNDGWQVYEEAPIQNKINSLQSQIDGEITTWFDDYTPDVTTEPWVTWESIDDGNEDTVEQDRHTGDIFYDTSSGHGYRFTKVGEVFSWGVITDNTITQALANAANAQDTADGKRRVFTTTPTVPYDIGDLWAQGSSGDLFRCKIAKANNETYSIADWELASKYTDDTAVTSLNTGLGNGTVAINLTAATLDGSKSIQTYVTEEIDKEVVVYSGTDHTLQTGMKTNDIYIEKTVDTTGAVDIDVLNTYTYNGTSWGIIGNNDNLTALADLADGKRTIYADRYNATAPAGEIRDVWIPIDDDVTPYDADTMPTAYIPGEIYQFTTVWELATKYTEDLTTYADLVNPQLSTLQNQVDGKIEYLFYDNPTNNPLATISSSWGEAENGNVVYYVDSDDGYWYQSSTDTFVQLVDTSMLSALKAASIAQATADGKVTTFYQATSPDAEGVGDIWVHETTKVVKTWSGAAWEDTTNATAEQAQTWAAGASKLITSPEGNITGWGFADGSNVDSQFKIQADKFMISNGYSTHQPLTIDTTTGISTFNGVVNFGSVLGAPGTIKAGVKADHTSFTNINAGEFFVHGTNSSGEATDTAFEVRYNDTTHTIAKSVANVSNAYSGTTQYIVTRASGTWVADSIDRTVVIARYDSGTWTYDNNVEPTALGTLQDTWFVIGTVTIEKDPDSTPYGKVVPTLWAAPVPVKGINSPAGGDLAFSSLSNVTTIDGGKITTGSVSTGKLQTGIGLISSGFTHGYTDPIPSGTTPSGFRLDASRGEGNATEEYPTIYGGYIRGGTISGATIIGHKFDIGTDLVLLTTEGVETKGVWRKSVELLSGGTDNSTTIDKYLSMGISSAETASTITNSYSIVSNSGGTTSMSVGFDGFYSDDFGAGSEPTTLICSGGCEDSPTVTASVYHGSTFMGSVTVNTKNTANAAIFGGFGICVQLNLYGTGYAVVTRNVNEPTFNTATGDLKVRVQVSGTSLSLSTSNTSIVHYNL